MGVGWGGVVVVNVQKASFQNMKQKSDRSRLLIAASVLSSIVNPSFAFYTYIYIYNVTFIFPLEGSLKVHLQFVHSSVLRVYIYV